MHLVGLDIGGSKTHALSRVPGVDDLELFAGSANLASVGPAESGRQLGVIFGALLESGRGPVDVVCAGAAGVDTPAGLAAMRALLSERAPSATITVVHDAHLIMAAAGLDEGIALIAGTGSVAWGRDRTGRSARAGGWGYLLGDEGSGYAVVREAVRHALRLADRALAPDRLARELMAACGVARTGGAARPLLRPTRASLLGRLRADRLRSRRRRRRCGPADPRHRRRGPGRSGPRRAPHARPARAQPGRTRRRAAPAPARASAGRSRTRWPPSG